MLSLSGDPPSSNLRGVNPPSINFRRMKPSFAKPAYRQAGLRRVKKVAGYSHRTAQPPTLAAFRPWEDSAGAGRVRPAGAKIRQCNRMIPIDSKKMFIAGRQNLPGYNRPVRRPWHQRGENIQGSYNCFRYPSNFLRHFRVVQVLPFVADQAG